MSYSWTGRTTFNILHKTPKAGHSWQSGRLTKNQQTTRPPSVFVEEWGRLGPKGQQKAIREWEIEGPAREKARAKRGILSDIVIKDDEAEFERTLSEACLKYSMKEVPAMPLRAAANELPFKERGLIELISQYLPKEDPVRVSGNAMPLYTARTKSFGSAQRPHDDKIEDSHMPNTENFVAMVHKPIKIPDALKIPEGRAAIKKEWDKLENLPAWDVNKVKPRAEVQEKGQASEVTTHFGTVVPLCHIKNSELGEEFWSYKGRVEETR